MIRTLLPFFKQCMHMLYTSSPPGVRDIYTFVMAETMVDVTYIMYLVDSILPRATANYQ